MLSWFLLFMVALAGVMTPVQASINAILGRSLGHPVSAAVVSTGVSFSLLMITGGFAFIFSNGLYFGSNAKGY